MKKRRTLVEKDKCIYAPMSGVGGVVYDKDAVYIDLGLFMVRKQVFFAENACFMHDKTRVLCLIQVFYV